MRFIIYQMKKEILDNTQISSIKIYIPKLIIKMLYIINKVTIKKQFIDENSIKLITDNIYTSEKLMKNIKLEYRLKG